MAKISRVTLFKLEDPEAIEGAIQKYSTLTQDAKKDGKTYIQLASAAKTFEDPRSQGYTLLVRTVFLSKQDMDFYDSEDEAHKAIKAFLKPRAAGPPLVVYAEV
ncbi:hypothetical protein ACN47E_003807 [Coniothyrium glycines]